MRTLVLDDDQIQLELAGAALESCGYDQFEARSDVGSCLKQIESGVAEFEIYLVDLVMPETDGIEACRRIRHSANGASAAIIMMTAQTDRACIDQAFSAGADDYIIKPFDDVELSNRLANVLRRKELPSSSVLASDLYVGDSIDISGVDGLTPASTMEAYLSALDKGRASLSMATAFQVQDWNSRTKDLLANEFTDLISSLAAIISNQLTKTTHVLSYFGDGSFVCITKLADPAISARMGRELMKDAVALDCSLLMQRNLAPPLPTDRPLDMIKAALTSVRTSPVLVKPQSGTALPDFFQL